MQRARAVVPPPSGQTTIPEQTYKTGHTNSSSLPMYQSEGHYIPTATLYQEIKVLISCKKKFTVQAATEQDIWS